MRKQLSILALTLASLSAQAVELDVLNFGNWEQADPSLIVGFGSKHFKNSEYLNETNPSIGFELWDIQAVYVHKNSYEHKSLYLTWSPELYEGKYFDISGNFGFATGYHKQEVRPLADGGTITFDLPVWQGLAPVLGATLKMHVHKDVDVNISVAYNVTMFSASYKF